MGHYAEYCGAVPISLIDCRRLTEKTGKPNWRGRLSTVDLLIKVGCFVKRVNNICNIKSSSSKLVSTTVLSCTVLSCTVLSCTVLSCTVLSCTVLSCTVLSCTVLSCTVLSCTVLYWTVLFWNPSVRLPWRDLLEVEEDFVSVHFHRVDFEAQRLDQRLHPGVDVIQVKVRLGSEILDPEPDRGVELLLVASFGYGGKRLELHGTLEQML